MRDDVPPAPMPADSVTCALVGQQLDEWWQSLDIAQRMTAYLRSTGSTGR